MKNWALISSFVLICCTSCAPFQDSPFSDDLLSNQRDLNSKAISKISNIESDGVIRMAILADAHQNYKDLDNAIYEINKTRSIDFVVNLGDFTNSGYNLEYDQYISSVVTVRYPTITVVGNHDSIGAGPALFRKAFSHPNFYFESTSHRFIFFNSANLENPSDFSSEWLINTVNASTKPVIIFTHCSLLDPERFVKNGTSLFSDVITSAKVQLILNGHNHVYSLTQQSSTVLLQVERVQRASWVLLEIKDHQLTITNNATGESTEVTLKN